MSMFLSLLLLSAPSAVDRVTVLADRAEVQRVARGPCADGRAQLVFAELPQSLDERTLQATASGPAQALGLSAREVVLAAEDRGARRRQLEAALLEARAEQRALADRAQNFAEELRHVSGFMSYSEQILREEVRSPKPSWEAWKRTLDPLLARELELEQANLGLAPRRRAVEQSIARLEAERARLGGEPERVTREVTVVVDCKGAATAEVRLAYVVPGATWRPEYALYFQPSAGARTGPGRAQLTVAALVSQSTGEDWSGSEIVLSTAKPRLGTEAPYPATITVDAAPAGDTKTLVRGVEDRSSLVASRQPTSAAGPTGATLDDGGRAFTLRFPGRATILSDGRPYWLPVDELEAAAKAKLIAVPKLSARVFQAVSLDNPARYPLLAGRVRVHRGGAFVGDVAMPHTGPGAAVELSLGTDAEFRVERADLAPPDRSPGFLSSTRRLERALRIKLWNQSKRREKIELRESIPVSKDEELKIELDRAKTTPGFEQDGLRGFLTWSVDLAPGADGEVKLSYAIALPSSWQLQ